MNRGESEALTTISMERDSFQENEGALMRRAALIFLLSLIAAGGVFAQGFRYDNVLFVGSGGATAQPSQCAALRGWRRLPRQSRATSQRS